MATFLVCHGAWSAGWAWKKVRPLLRAAGHEVFTPTYTGLGERAHQASPTVDLETHIKDVLGVIECEGLDDITLLGHSYGGMVVTGVADRIPDRIKRVVYLDAWLPSNGESNASLMHFLPAQDVKDFETMTKDGFVIPTWVKPDQAPPHDVPHPLKTFTDPIVLKNEAARKVPVTYILFVRKGTKPENDEFYSQYERAKTRGIQTLILTSEHNAEWTAPRELVRMLVQFH